MFSLLLTVPVLNVFKNLLFVNVGDSIMGGKLFGEVGFARARFAGNCDFEWFETSFLTEFILDLLNVVQTLMVSNEYVLLLYCTHFIPPHA